MNSSLRRRNREVDLKVRSDRKDLKKGGRKKGGGHGMRE